MTDETTDEVQELFPQSVHERMATLLPVFEKALEKAEDALERAKLQVRYKEDDLDSFRRTMKLQKELEDYAVAHGLEIQHDGEAGTITPNWPGETAEAEQPPAPEGEEAFDKEFADEEHYQPGDKALAKPLEPVAEEIIADLKAEGVIVDEQADAPAEEPASSEEEEDPRPAACIVKFGAVALTVPVAEQTRYGELVAAILLEAKLDADYKLFQLNGGDVALSDVIKPAAYGETFDVTPIEPQIPDEAPAEAEPAPAAEEEAPLPELQEDELGIYMLDDQGQLDGAATIVPITSYAVWAEAVAATLDAHGDTDSPIGDWVLMPAGGGGPVDVQGKMPKKAGGKFYYLGRKDQVVRSA